MSSVKYLPCNQDNPFVFQFIFGRFSDWLACICWICICGQAAQSIDWKWSTKSRWQIMKFFNNLWNKCIGISVRCFICWFLCCGWYLPDLTSANKPIYQIWMYAQMLLRLQLKMRWVDDALCTVMWVSPSSSKEISSYYVFFSACVWLNLFWNVQNHWSWNLVVLICLSDMHDKFSQFIELIKLQKLVDAWNEYSVDVYIANLAKWLSALWPTEMEK